MTEASRRAFLGAALAAPAILSGCAKPDDWRSRVEGRWIGDNSALGHRVRDARASPPAPARERRCDVLVIGGGIAGLAAARALQRAGVHGPRAVGSAKPRRPASATACAKRRYCACVAEPRGTAGSMPSCQRPSMNSRSCGLWHSWRSSHFSPAAVVLARPISTSQSWMSPENGPGSGR